MLSGNFRATFSRNSLTEVFIFTLFLGQELWVCISFSALVLLQLLVLGAVLNAILVAVVEPVLLPVVVWLLFSRYELLVVPGTLCLCPSCRSLALTQRPMRIHRPACVCV